MAIFTFDTLNSTNLHLKQNFNKYNHFDVIMANHQTHGYGRFKRTWLDLGGENIFMSICLKLNDFNENVFSIAQFTALMLAKTFENYNVIPQIKWPNDIHINYKKISGILAESIIKNSEFQGIVLGIGININASNEKFNQVSQNVTSLFVETDIKINKNDFVNSFMDLFIKNYDEFMSHGFIYFKEDYLSYLNCLNKKITITNKENTFIGISKGVNDKGLLLLEIDNKIMEISAGDINF